MTGYSSASSESPIVEEVTRTWNAGSSDWEHVVSLSNTYDPEAPKNVSVYATSISSGTLDDLTTGFYAKHTGFTTDANGDIDGVIISYANTHSNSIDATIRMEGVTV